MAYTNPYSGVESLKKALFDELVKHKKAQSADLMKQIAVKIAHWLPILRAELAKQMFENRGAVAGRQAWDANKESTIKSKHSDYPLVDTGQLMATMSDPNTYRSPNGSITLTGSNFNDEYSSKFATSVAVEDTGRFRSMVNDAINRGKFDWDMSNKRESNSDFADMIKKMMETMTQPVVAGTLIQMKLNEKRPFIDIGTRPLEKQWIFDRLLNIIKADFSIQSYKSLNVEPSSGLQQIKDNIQAMKSNSKSYKSFMAKHKAEVANRAELKKARMLEVRKLRRYTTKETEGVQNSRTYQPTENVSIWSSLLDRTPFEDNTIANQRAKRGRESTHERNQRGQTLEYWMNEQDKYFAGIEARNKRDRMKRTVRALNNAKKKADSGTPGRTVTGGTAADARRLQKAKEAEQNKKPIDSQFAESKRQQGIIREKDIERAIVDQAYNAYQQKLSAPTTTTTEAASATIEETKPVNAKVFVKAKEQYLNDVSGDDDYGAPDDPFDRYS